jgi:hypothetical protein
MVVGIGLAEQIKDSALHSKDWRHHEEAEIAYKVYDALNVQLYQSELPQAVIGFDESGRIKKDGHYHYEGDDVSLKHHIDLAKGLSPLAMVIALIHNMEHLRSEVYGSKSSWYHKTAWKMTMGSHGLEANSKGDVTAITNIFMEEVFRPVAAQPLSPTTTSAPIFSSYGITPSILAESDEDKRFVVNFQLVNEFLFNGQKSVETPIPTEMKAVEISKTTEVDEETGEMTGTITFAPALASIDEDNAGMTYVEEMAKELGVLDELEEVVASMPAITTAPVTTPPVAKTKKTTKYVCGCVAGIAPDGSLGSTAIWTTRMGQGSICGACQLEFCPV